MELSREDLLNKYKQFKLFCNEKGNCNCCKYKGEDVCFVSYVFDDNTNDNIDSNKDTKVDGSVRGYCEAKLTLLNGVVVKHKVKEGYFFELKKYVIRIIDIVGKYHFVNRRSVKSVILTSYDHKGNVIYEKEVWVK